MTGLINPRRTPYADEVKRSELGEGARVVRCDGAPSPGTTN